MPNLESLCVADAKSLQTNTGTLSVFTNEKGGINDDLILSSADNFLYVVTNAGTREKDMAAMSKKLQEMKAKGKDVTLRFADERGLLAVQGEFFTKLKRLIVCVNSFFLYILYCFYVPLTLTLMHLLHKFRHVQDP